MVSRGNEKGVCVYYNIYGHDNIIIYRGRTIYYHAWYKPAARYIYREHTHTHKRLWVGVAETQEAATGPRRGVRAIHHGNKYRKKKK